MAQRCATLPRGPALCRVRRGVLALLGVCALATGWPGSARAGPGAASAPGPVTLVVPFSAGGPTDRVARELAERLAPVLGRSVVIENVDGAGGTLGATKVAKASPDGDTLLLHHIGMATAPALYRSLPFDPLEDFRQLGMIAEVPMTLVGRPGLPARNFGELVTWLKANQAKAHLANAGLGAASHLCGMLLQQHLKLSLTTVSYKGTGPALSDLLGGQVDILCDQTTNTTEPIAESHVRAYAVTTQRPLSLASLALVPTLDSLGLSGFHITIWHGLYAPRGTPPQRVAELNIALRRALLDPELRARFKALGAAPIDDDRLGPEGHRRFLEAEIKRWAPTIRATGQYAD